MMGEMKGKKAFISHLYFNVVVNLFTHNENVCEQRLADFISG